MTSPEDKSKEFGHLSSEYDSTCSFGSDSSQGDNPNPFNLSIERYIKRINPESDPARMDIETLTDEQYLDYLRSLPESD